MNNSDTKIESNNQYVQIFAKIRPLTQEEEQDEKKNGTCILVAQDNKEIYLKMASKMWRKYKFDYVFDENHQNTDLFDISCKYYIDKFLEGYNSSLFTYGQTGTGKTYSMGILNTLNENSDGVIPSSQSYIFKELGESKTDEEAHLCISIIQIYRDEIFDLLNPTRIDISVREDSETKCFFIPGLVVVPVETLSQALEQINAGLSTRAIASQKINTTSSRSHFILTVYLKKKKEIEGRKVNVLSKLTFVDLAGNERVGKSSSSGVRLEEAKAINTSLANLANVISSLRSEKLTYHFRKSKLTKILQTSLVGECYIGMFSMIRKSSIYLFESMSTLAFALQCKQIRKSEPVQYMFNDVFKSVYSIENDSSRYVSQSKVGLKCSQNTNKNQDEDCNQSEELETQPKIESCNKNFITFLMKCILLITKVTNDIDLDINTKKKKIQDVLGNLLSDLNIENFLDQVDDLDREQDLEATERDKSNQISTIEDIIKSDDPYFELEKQNTGAENDFTSIFQSWFKNIVKTLKNSHTEIATMDKFKDQMDDLKLGIASNFEKQTKCCASFNEKIVGEQLMTKYECQSVRRLSEKRLTQLMEMYKENIFRALNCELNQMKSTIVDFHWLDQIITENLAPEKFMTNFSEYLNYNNINKSNQEEDELIDKSCQMNTNEFISPVKDDDFTRGDNMISKKNYDNFNYTLSGTKSQKLINKDDELPQDYDLELREISCSNINNKTSYMDAQSSTQNVYMNNTNSLKGILEENQILKLQIVNLQKEFDDLKNFQTNDAKEIAELEKLKYEVDNWITIRDKTRQNEINFKEELSESYSNIEEMKKLIDSKDETIAQLYEKIKESNKNLSAYEDMMNEVSNYKSSTKNLQKEDTKNLTNKNETDLSQSELEKQLADKDQEISIESNRNNEQRKYNEEQNEELTKIKKENESFKIQNNKTIKELEDHKVKNSVLIMENDKLKEEFSMRISHYDTIKKELEKIKKNNNDVEQKISNLETKNVELLTDNVKLNEMVDKSKLEYDSVQNKYESILSELEVLETEYRNKDEQLKDKQGLLSTKDTKIQELITKNKEAETTIIDLEQKLDQSVYEQQDLNTKFDEKEQIFNESQNEVSKNLGHIAELKEQISLQQNDKKVVKDDLEEQKKSLSELVKKLENENLDYIKKYDILNGENIQLKKGLLDNNSIVFQYESTCKENTELQSKLQDELKKVQEFSELSKNLENSNKNLESSNKSLNLELKEAKTTIYEINQEKQSHIELIANLNQENELQLSQKNSLKEKIDILEFQFTELNEKYNKEIKDLERSIMSEKTLTIDIVEVNKSNIKNEESQNQNCTKDVYSQMIDIDLNETQNFTKISKNLDKVNLENADYNDQNHYDIDVNAENNLDIKNINRGKSKTEQKIVNNTQKANMKHSLQDFNKESLDHGISDMNNLNGELVAKDILNDTNKNVTNLAECYMNQLSSDKKQDIHYNAPEEAFIKKSVENRQKQVNEDAKVLRESFKLEYDNSQMCNNSSKQSIERQLFIHEPFEQRVQSTLNTETSFTSINNNVKYQNNSFTKSSNNLINNKSNNILENRNLVTKDQNSMNFTKVSNNLLLPRSSLDNIKTNSNSKSFKDIKDDTTIQKIINNISQNKNEYNTENNNTDSSNNIKFRSVANQSNIYTSRTRLVDHPNVHRANISIQEAVNSKSQEKQIPNLQESTRVLQPINSTKKSIINSNNNTEHKSGLKSLSKSPLVQKTRLLKDTDNLPCDILNSRIKKSNQKSLSRSPLVLKSKEFSLGNQQSASNLYQNNNNTKNPLMGGLKSNNSGSKPDLHTSQYYRKKIPEEDYLRQLDSSMDNNRNGSLGRINEYRILTEEAINSAKTSIIQNSRNKNLNPNNQDQSQENKYVVPVQRAHGLANNQSNSTDINNILSKYTSYSMGNNQITRNYSGAKILENQNLANTGRINTESDMNKPKTLR